MLLGRSRFIALFPDSEWPGLYLEMKESNKHSERYPVQSEVRKKAVLSTEINPKAKTDTKASLKEEVRDTYFKLSLYPERPNNLRQAYGKTES